MLQTDAKRLATAIETQANADRPSSECITATVKADSQPARTLAPGAGRPIFTRYYIQITDGARVAMLDLDQASTLLEDLQPDWDPDQIFDALRSRGLPVEDAS